MTTKKFHVSVTEPVVELIESRGARSTVITRDLERLYTLYSRALRQINLTVQEACLIVDALNSSIITADTPHMLWASVEDAIKYEDLASKWDIDGAGLVEKLRGYNEIQNLAIVDAAERFWNVGSDSDMRETVRQCFGGAIRE